MIKEFDNFILYEKTFNQNNVDLILEKNMFSSYKDIQRGVIKDYGTQLYFVFTFNAAILSLYPIISEVVYNSNYDIKISTYQIVLLTIFAIAEIIHINNDAIKNISRKLESEGVLIYLKEVKNTLLSIEKIVKIVASTIGKTISFFVDMLGYVTILIPINDAIIEIIKDGELDPNILSKKIFGFGVGLGIFTLKNIILKIFEKIGIHRNHKSVENEINNIAKNSNGDNSNKNVYHNMRTKEKIKK